MLFTDQAMEQVMDQDQFTNQNTILTKIQEMVWPQVITIDTKYLKYKKDLYVFIW